ncbi:hypothetical protein [Heyndrickxia camelliae]|nr:hypothetical protein [Heyndrickxia camelliae]
MDIIARTMFFFFCSPNPNDWAYDSEKGVRGGKEGGKNQVG